MAENEKSETGETNIEQDTKPERENGELRAPPRRRKSWKKTAAQRVAAVEATKPSRESQVTATESTEIGADLEEKGQQTKDMASTNENVENDERIEADPGENTPFVLSESLGEEPSIDSARSTETEICISSTPDRNENISDSVNIDMKVKDDRGNSHDFHKIEEGSKHSEQSEDVSTPPESVNDSQETDEMGLKCSSLYRRGQFDKDDISSESESQSEGTLSRDAIQNGKIADSSERRGLITSKEVETFCWVDTQPSPGNDHRTIAMPISVNDDPNYIANDDQPQSPNYQRLDNRETDSSAKSDNADDADAEDDEDYSTATESDQESFYSDFTSSEGEYNMEDAERLFGVGNLLGLEDSSQSFESEDQTPEGVDTVKEILSVFPSTEYLVVTDEDEAGQDGAHVEQDKKALHGDSTCEVDPSSTNVFDLSDERAQSLERKIGSFQIVEKAELLRSEQIRIAQIRRNNSFKDRGRKAILRKVSEETLGDIIVCEGMDDETFKDHDNKTEEVSHPRHGSYSSNHEKEGTLELSRDRHFDGSPRVRSRSEGDINALDIEEHQWYNSLPRRAKSSKLISGIGNLVLQRMGTGDTDDAFEREKSDSSLDKDEDRTLVAETENLDGSLGEEGNQTKAEDGEGRPCENKGALVKDSYLLDNDLRKSLPTLNSEKGNVEKEIRNALGDIPRSLSVVKEETASLLEFDLHSYIKTSKDDTLAEHALHLEAYLPQSESVKEDTQATSLDREVDGSFDSPNKTLTPSKVTFEGDEDTNKPSASKETSAVEDGLKKETDLRVESPSKKEKKTGITRHKSAPSDLTNKENNDGNNNDNNVLLRKRRMGSLRRKWLSFSMVETSSKSLSSDDDNVRLKSYRKKKGSTSDEPDSGAMSSSPSKTPERTALGDSSHDSVAGAAVEEGKLVAAASVDVAEEANEVEESPKRPPRKVKALGHSRSFNTPATERKLVEKRNKKVRAERSFRWQTLSGGIDVTAAELFRISRLSTYKPVELLHDGPVTLVTDSLAAMFPHFPTDKRSQVALELYTTERTYVRGLETIVELFKSPLKDYLDTKEMETMFSNIHSIFQLNKDMVFSLCERITHWKDEQCIGDIFSEMAPRFKIYAAYCNNYNAAETLIKQKIKRRKEFENFLNTCYSDPVCQPGLTLQAYLITVVQRIPRYLLLLRDLLKTTPAHHPDHRNLKDGLEKMHNLAEYINNQLQAVQGQRAMAELRSRVIGIKAFETQGRALIKEGEVSLMITKKIYKCLLFNDMLVFAATNATKQSEVELTLELKTIWVSDLEDNDPQTSKEDAIEVYTPERSYMLYAGSRNEKKLWLQKLRTAIAIQLHGDEATFNQDITRRKAAFTYKDGRIYCGSFVDGKRHGHGVLAWQNRTRYEGMFEDDERHGIGVLTYNTGEKYRGQFENDKQWGVGTLTYPNSDYYHGEWRDGKMHGKGIIEFNNKDILNGEFVDGDIQGVAILKCSNGMSYQGSWKNSKKHGKGKLVMANGDTYSGEFFNDHMHGHGEMQYAKQGSTYNGQWKNSQRHGMGTYKLPDGTIYEGEWSGDHIQGRGKMEYPNKDSYDGTWFRNMRFGKGIYRFHEGIYEGQFDYDLRHGMGIMRYHDSAEYEGEWQNDQRHGNGKMIYADLAVYEGAWFHNLRHGKGKMAYHGGATYDGSWDLDSEHGLDGVYTDAKSKYAYRGEWLHGRREGRGVETTAHSAYEGEFKANMRHGRGQETLKCGTVYEGRWKEDRKCGEGTRKVMNAAPELQHWKEGHLLDKEETVAPDLPLHQRR